MNGKEYLISRVANLHIGVYCRDVCNIFCKEIRITKMFYQNDLYIGVAKINDHIVNIIDFERRIGEPSRTYSGLTKENIIVFQTSVDQQLGLIVDQIIGLKMIEHEDIVKSSNNFNNHQENIHLLFPDIAKTPDGKLIHLMDVTYLGNTEPVPEDSGDLEFF